MVSIDGHFVLHRGESVRFTQGMWDERRVAHPFWHVAFVARQHEQMVEIEVARFQYAHHLNAFSGLAMERNAGGLNELGHEAFEGSEVDGEVASCDQVCQSVD